MSETNHVPELTLDFNPSPAPAPAAEPVVKKEEPQPEQIVLSEEEEKMVQEFMPKIDLHNSTLVLQYGAGTQQKIADFSQTVLDNVRTKDMGQVGDMLSQVVTELQNFDAAEEEDKGFFSFFKRSSNKISSLQAKYSKAETNVERICETLEKHQIQLMKDSALLDKMYEMNVLYFKELCMYIVAGKRRLEQIHQEELPALTAKAQQSNLPEDAQAVNDLNALCGRFEKKLHDLELTRMVSIQMAPQIRLVQNNNSLMSDKIQSTLVNTIPLWKSQMVLALGMEHSNQAIQAQRQVTDMTNELLRRNADALKMASLDTAREAERGIVDLDTLRQTNESLISTLDEVMQIQADGRQKRKEAEAEIQRLEGQLKQKLLSMKG